MRRFFFILYTVFLSTTLFFVQNVSAQQQMPDFVLHAAQTLNEQYAADIDVNNVIWDYVDYNVDVTNATLNCPRLDQAVPMPNNVRVYRIDFQPVRDGLWGDELWEAIVYSDLSYVALCSAPPEPTAIPTTSNLPTSTPSICGSMPSRLVIGQEARVAGDIPNNVRAEFGTSGTYVGEIPANAVFLVVDGPRCTIDGAWWYVNYNGILGWTLEGQEVTYFLEPMSLVDTQAPIQATVAPLVSTSTPAPIVCNPNMPSRLIIGELGRVTPGIPNNVRAQAGSSSAYVGEIPAEAVFTVLAGPTCASGLAWWQVDYNGMIGWTAEGADADYWLEPQFASFLPLSTENMTSLSQYASFELTNIQNVAFTPSNTLYALNTDSARRYSVTDGFADALNLTWNEEGVISINQILAIREIDETRGWVAVGLGTDTLAIGQYGLDGFYETLYQVELNIISVVFSPDGRYLMLADENQSIQVFDTTTGQFTTSLPLDTSGIITQMQFSPDGQVFVISFDDGFTAWQVNNWAVLSSTFFESPQTLQALTINNNHIAFALASPQDTIAFVTPLSTIGSWSNSSGIRYSGVANDLVLASDSSFLLLATNQGLSISTMPNNELLTAQALTLNFNITIQQMQVSTDGRFLALVSENTVELWVITTP